MPVFTFHEIVISSSIDVAMHTLRNDMIFVSGLDPQLQVITIIFNKYKTSVVLILDLEPRGARLAEKVTNFYAYSSDLHTLSYVKVVVCRTHSGGYGQGGDEKIKLLLNSIAVIKSQFFIP